MHPQVDPNLFYLDFERVSEVLLTILVFALLIERALSIIFESRLFIERVDYTVKRSGSAVKAGDRDGSPEPITEATPRNRGLKEFIALGVSFLVCWKWDFDALSILMPVSHPHMTLVGELITAMVVAGGSKGAHKLFTDWLGIKSSAKDEIDTFKKRRTGGQGS